MSERDEFEAIRGDLMMVIEYCETQTYIERGSAMWDGLANLRRYAAARATPQQAVPALTDEQILLGVAEFADENMLANHRPDILRCVRSLLAAAPQPSQEPQKAVWTEEMIARVKQGAALIESKMVTRQYIQD